MTCDDKRTASRLWKTAKMMDSLKQVMVMMMVMLMLMMMVMVMVMMVMLMMMMMMMMMMMIFYFGSNAPRYHILSANAPFSDAGVQ